MAQEDLNALDDAIAKLGNRYNDLDEASIAPAQQARTLDILDLMELVNMRITSLETKRSHLRAATISVAPPSLQDTNTIKDALQTLSQHVAKDMQWDMLFHLTKQILVAANQIEKNFNVRQTG